MDAIIEHMTTAPLWRGESEEGYIAIRDYLEKYILAKIGRYAFHSVECPEDDEFLLKRMSLLSFIQTKVHRSVFFLIILCSIWILKQNYAMILFGL